MLLPPPLGPTSAVTFPTGMSSSRRASAGRSPYEQAHGVEPDGPGEPRRSLRPRGVGHQRRRLEHLEEPLGRRGPLGGELRGSTQLLHRLVQEDERGEERQQPLRRHLHASTRPDQHRRHGHRRQHLGHRGHRRAGPGCPGQRLGVRIGPCGKARRLQLLHSVGLYRADRRESLAELSGHSSETHLPLAGAPEHRAGEPRDREPGDGHHRQRHQRQPPVERHRHPGEHDDLQPVTDPRAHRVDRRRLHRAHVRREAREEVPAHPAGELHRRLAQESIEERPAEPGHRPLPELAGPGELRAVGEPLHQGHRDQRQREREEQPLAARGFERRRPARHPSQRRGASGEQEAQRRSHQEGVQARGEREHRHRQGGEHEPPHMRACVRHEPPQGAPPGTAADGVLRSGGHQGPEVYHPAFERPWPTAS